MADLSVIIIARTTEYQPMKPLITCNVCAADLPISVFSEERAVCPDCIIEGTTKDKSLPTMPDPTEFRKAVATLVQAQVALKARGHKGADLLGEVNWRRWANVVGIAWASDMGFQEAPKYDTTDKWEAPNEETPNEEAMSRLSQVLMDRRRDEFPSINIPDPYEDDKVSED